MLSEDAKEKYLQAGVIAENAKKRALGLLRPGAMMLDVAEAVEKLIADSGGKPAFPVNMSAGPAAAHYTPAFGDGKTVGKGELLKIDIGAHVDGYIADLAFTYCSEGSRLIDASRKALLAGIDKVRPGVQVSDISRAIYDSIVGSGFGPVVNLTGHGLDRYDFHGKVTIPNVPTNINHVLGDGDVIALEPFVCETAGNVKESGQVEIYRLVAERPVRSADARLVMKKIAAEFGPFPFAKRWVCRWMSPFRAGIALQELERAGVLETFPVLKEQSGKVIAQSEATIIVGEEPVVTTGKI